MQDFWPKYSGLLPSDPYGAAGRGHPLPCPPSSKPMLSDFDSSPAQYFRRSAATAYSRQWILYENLHADVTFEWDIVNIDNTTCSVTSESIAAKYSPRIWSSYPHMPIGKVDISVTVCLCVCTVTDVSTEDKARQILHAGITMRCSWNRAACGRRIGMCGYMSVTLTNVIVSLFFHYVSCARLSWSSRQLPSARKYSQPHRIVKFWDF